MTGWILFGEFFAVAAAFILGRIHVDQWAVHALARARGGQWFTTRRGCPGCGTRVHVMRIRTDVLAALEDPCGDGYFCLFCSSGRTR